MRMAHQLATTGVEHETPATIPMESLQPPLYICRAYACAARNTKKNLLERVPYVREMPSHIPR